MKNPTAEQVLANIPLLGAILRRRRTRKMETCHGFPCASCGAKTFEEAGNLCNGYRDCPGDSMSKEVFK